MCVISCVWACFVVSQPGQTPETPISSAPGLTDAICYLPAWPAATSVSARPVQRSGYTLYYQTNGARQCAPATQLLTVYGWAEVPFDAVGSAPQTPALSGAWPAAPSARTRQGADGTALTSPGSRTGWRCHFFELPYMYGDRFGS